MRIHNLYQDSAGASHFRDIEVAWEELRQSNKFSTRQPASGIVFRETTKDYTVDWHPAPCRQSAINLDGAAHVTAGDGETRNIGPGEVVLVEDTTGRGHISKFIGSAMRRSIFVMLD
jgi:hypothetical protein